MWTRCPDAHQLAAYADGRLDDRGRDAISRHLAECDRCLDAVALVTRLAGEHERPAVPSALLARARALSPRDARSPLVRWAPALASAALIVVAAAVVFQQQTLAPAPVPSGVSEADPARDVRTGTEAVAAPVVVAPAEEAVLSGSPVRVEWSIVPGAVYYQVRIAADDGALVWEGRASGAASSIVADAAVRAGGRYYVTVMAHATGDRSVRSRAVAFQIDRRAP